MHLLDSAHFNQFSPGYFDPILGSIRSPSDPWMTVADFASFVEAQRRAAHAFRDPERWTRMSIINAARCGRFSSDRTIREYNAQIWKLDPVAPLATL